MPLAGADAATEKEPGCERDQPWILYGRSDLARDAYEGQGSPGGLALCEGEHWDGQDAVSSDGASCSGALSTDPDALHASMCLGPDPNAAPGEDALQPLGFRVSSDGERAYASANVAFAARIALHVDDGSLALYARDNTPGNLLTQLARPPSPVPHYPAESDCDQATYEAQASSQDQRCSRDNTAVTLEHGLLP